MIKVGGGWVTLDQYIKEYIQKQQAMIKHKGTEQKEVLARDSASKTQKRTSVNTSDQKPKS